jgi:hypothetical protein
MTYPKCLLLHQNDNVVICVARLAANERVIMDDTEIVIPTAVEAGYKLARRPLNPGDAVIKQGVRIGTITTPVRPGDYIHLHNMQSDYRR